MGFRWSLRSLTKIQWLSTYTHSMIRSFNWRISSVRAIVANETSVASGPITYSSASFSLSIERVPITTGGWLKKRKKQTRNSKFSDGKKIGTVHCYSLTTQRRRGSCRIYIPYKMKVKPFLNSRLLYVHNFSQFSITFSRGKKTKASSGYLKRFSNSSHK